MLLLLALAKPRIKRKRLGFSLGFCPVCRCVSTCRAVQLKLLAGLSIGGTPQRLTHELTCTGCQTPVEVEGRPVTCSKKPVEDVRSGLAALLGDEAGPIQGRMELERR